MSWYSDTGSMARAVPYVNVNVRNLHSYAWSGGTSSVRIKLLRQDFKLLRQDARRVKSKLAVHLKACKPALAEQTITYGMQARMCV